MNECKNKFTIRVAAYIIMMVCLAASAASSVIVAYSISNQYYFSGENVYTNIKEACLNEAYNDIMDEIETGNMAEYGRNGEMIRLLKNEISGEELITGENEASEFGYVIRCGNDVIKRVNTGLIKSYGKSGASDRGDIVKRTYHMYNDTGKYSIDMYIGNIEGGELPELLNKTAITMLKMYGYRIPAAVMLAVSSVLALTMMIFLTAASGKKETNRIRYIPLDITAAFAAVVVTAAVTSAFPLEGENIDLIIAEFTLSAVVASAAVTGWILLFAARARQGRWWHSTVVFFILSKAAGLLKWIGRQAVMVVKGLPVVWKSMILYIAASFVNLMIMIIAMSLYSPEAALLLWMVGFIITGMFVFLTAIRMKAVKTGAEHIAAGDLEYQIDEKGMYLDLREHAETLNNIRKGLSVAVDEKIRSERMKTELITNVSHDIKTPLTSIINYIDFLKKEDLGSDKATEYVDVLDRQSQRLKKLIDDLTEASKASTGNVKIELGPCDAGVMMTQVMGEYQEKAENADLRLMLDIPDSSVMIMADGRQLWRILNNLMNNICKYSMPGTRVYQKLKIDGDKAVISYRNISKYELNISPDELTERFVRGDSSRHTEGSGLGLSIAQNLTELQNGGFSIDIDGDLFKVTVIFETIRTQ